MYICFQGLWYIWYGDVGEALAGTYPYNQHVQGDHLSQMTTGLTPTHRTPNFIANLLVYTVVHTLAHGEILRIDCSL